MRATVTFKTVAWQKQIARGLKDFADLADRSPNTATVGVDPSKANTRHPNSTLTYGALGALMEYGGGNVPERPHLRPTITANKRGWGIMLGKGMVKVAKSRRGLPELMQRVGNKMAEDVRLTIRRGVPPSNAPSTVSQKGFDHPLIETGLYMNSITAQVTKQ